MMTDGPGDMLPELGTYSPRHVVSAPLPGDDYRARPVWPVQQLAAWLKRNNPEPITLSEAWRLAHELAKGPLAEVWNAGVARGCIVTCATNGVGLTEYGKERQQGEPWEHR